MTVEELDAVRGYVSNIQAIKDAHNVATTIGTMNI